MNQHQDKILETVVKLHESAAITNKMMDHLSEMCKLLNEAQKAQRRVINVLIAFCAITAIATAYLYIG